MMLKNKKALLVVSLLVLALVLAACGSKPAGLEGKWHPEDSNMLFGGSSDNYGFTADQVAMEFTKDGKIVMSIDGKPLFETLKKAMLESGMPEEAVAQLGLTEPRITYKTDGEKITISIVLDGKTESSEGTFKVEGDKLTITVEGRDTSFVRAK